MNYLTENKKGLGHDNLSLWLYWSWRWDSNPRPADYKSAIDV